ncbi:hypothetical protein [Acanthopleuribacter pedis]|uniref:Uncharacterized protein n=1 Tax=Acanthopleuribacter pedis TaxID=442870 RepID=A0A8J7Q5J6_9BACT|nr:hypothetical protein [Acanthopleuribacter pedis]MBO1318279.1 hypothetical protein [Acanthopleuribacter pedis]
MPSLSIEFHAEPQELKEFIRDVALDQNLVLVLPRFQPFSINILNPETFHDHPLGNGVKDLNRFFLSRGMPDRDASSQMEFLDKNPALIIFDIGSYTSQELYGSWFSIKTEDTEMLETAKTISRGLKKITKAGAGYKTSSSDVGYDRNHRHTQKARDLYAQGVKMLPVAGAIEYLFDVPKPERKTKQPVQ